MHTAKLTADEIQYVCCTARDRSAIELDVRKSYLIEARLGPVAERNGFDSIHDLIHALREQPQQKLESQLVEALTTNETSFFRDRHPFETLRNRVFAAIQHQNADTKTLNIWSAACSTGQETYSIAMSLQDHFPDLEQWDVKVIATDISDNALARAEAGKYSQLEVSRGLPSELLMKHFQRSGVQWELRKCVRDRVRFMKLNLIDWWPALPAMDIVFLRNVLIYFAPKAKRMILEKVRQVMAPGGVLFLGAAESTMGLDADFERVQAGCSAFYRRK